MTFRQNFYTAEFITRAIKKPNFIDIMEDSLSPDQKQMLDIMKKLIGEVNDNIHLKHKSMKKDMELYFKIAQDERRSIRNKV